MLRLYASNLHVAGEPLDSIWPLRVLQRPCSGDPTIKPLMLRVKEVKREQHVMTSTFLDWVAFQLSSHQLSSLTHSPETPGNLLSKGEGPNNTTQVPGLKHLPLLQLVGRATQHRFTSTMLISQSNRYCASLSNKQHSDLLWTATPDN